jgi:predicted TIM-barrel fold metal-dependent hydrolase
MTANLHVNGPDLPKLENIVRTFPGLNVVLAHPGDGKEYIIRRDLVKKYRNLYLDISGTGLFRWGMLRDAVDVLGADKVLFGSDFPVCSVGMNLQGALSEPLTDEEFRLVLAGNFRRLTGI